ncbi:MAG: hypothetical protein U5K37_01170 [Natrialbaceae archaeon]|nr:hypothetical protein [Natrialbaceae archaeon]
MLVGRSGVKPIENQPLAGEDRDLQKQAITDAIGWLEDNGYDARFVSIPRDRYDDTTLELLAAHHELGFGSRIPCHGEIETPMLRARVNDPTGERVRHYLDLAERYGGVVSLDYYQLDDPASVSSLQMAVTEISSRRDSGSITVLTPDELMAFRA